MLELLIISVLIIVGLIIYGFLTRNRGYKFAASLLKSDESIITLFNVFTVGDASEKTHTDLRKAFSRGETIISSIVTGSYKVGYLCLTNKRLMLIGENALGTKANFAAGLAFNEIKDFTYEVSGRIIKIKIVETDGSEISLFADKRFNDQVVDKIVEMKNHLLSAKNSNIK